jgi:hypothetical protein
VIYAGYLSAAELRNVDLRKYMLRAS